MRHLLFLVVMLGTTLHAQQLVPFLKGKEWKVYDRTTQKFTGKTYTKIVAAQGGLLFVNNAGKWGAMNAQGKMVLAEDYATIEQLNRSVIAARDAKGILLADTNGVAITKERYKEATAYKLNKELIVVKNQSNRYGIINSKGKTVLELKYDFAPEHLNDGYLRVATRQSNGEALTGMLDSNFREVLPLKYHSIEVMADHTIRCSTTDQEHILFDPSFREIYKGPLPPWRVSGDFIYLDGGERTAFWIRKTRKTVVCPEEWSMQILEERGHVICYNYEAKGIRLYHANGDSSSLDGYGLVYLDRTLNTFVISNSAEDVPNRKFGFADFTGKIVLPCEYAYVNIWNDQYFSSTVVVRDDKGKNVGKYQLYDIRTGKPASPTLYEGIELLPLGGVALKDNGSWKLYDSNLKRWDDFEYTMVYRGQRLSAHSSSLPLYQVNRNGDAYRGGFIGYIDGTGRPVIPAIYHEVRLIASNYNDGRPGPRRIYAAWTEQVEGISHGVRRGIMLDAEGRKIAMDNSVTGLGYEMNGMFTAARTVVYEDEVRGLWGLVDSMGKIILPLEYDEVRQLGPGQGFLCTRNGVSVIADAQGKIIPSSPYPRISPLTGQFFMVGQYDRYGVMNSNGKVLTRLVYQDIYRETYLNGTLFRVKQNGIEFYVDNTGQEFYEP